MPRQPFRIGGDLVDDAVPVRERKQLAELLGRIIVALQKDLLNLTRSKVALSAANFVDNETPAGTGDPKVFTLTKAPDPPGSLKLFLRYSGGGAYLYMRQGEQYTLLGNRITYTFTPPTGFKHVAHYLVSSAS